jgi:adenine-specific DNA methylase
MPKVFDPFAGGGAIPLEAARLGCRSFGNDINPVAHIIQKGSLEFPQKYGKPITFSKPEFIKLYGEEHWNNQPQEIKLVKDGNVTGITIPNRLSFDIEYYAKKLLAETEKKIGYLYPADENGNKPIAYYWARVGECGNPSCKAKIPLLKGFTLANTKTKQVYMNPIVMDKNITFEIKKGKCELESWMSRGNLKCPVCGNSTDVNTLKQQFVNGKTTERLIAVICDGRDGKEYRLPFKNEIDILKEIPNDVERPSEQMPTKYTQALPSCTWGISKWSDLFTDRQIGMLQKLISSLNTLKIELSKNLGGDAYANAILSYLGIFIDRIAVANTSFGFWHTGGEKLERIMGRQAISMVFDYPESNPFCNSSGSALNQLDWLTRYIESECNQPFSTVLQNASSGEKTQFPNKSITAVVTDPPYYDAIAYADLSDFFYVWLKRTLADVYPLNFATPQTPKTEECTALKHHHSGDLQVAKDHFENKLLEIFDAIEYQTTDIVSIMFAHQSTEAWTTLCNSILGARMNITGSWATDTEMTGALKTDKSFLSSSVTVACKPAQRIGFGDYKQVKKDIEETVTKEVEELYALGFRGADLLTACFGQAVSEFGKYEKVERADGTEVTVADLLEMARESAFNALLKGFDGDDFTKFYIGWLQLYSFTESDFDDAAKFSRVGLTINVQELFTEHILIKNGNKQTLGTFEERIKVNKNLGDKSNSYLIDQVHRSMALYKGNNRGALLQYIAKIAAQPESSFWRVLTSICELLPNGCEDHKQAIGLLANKDSLIRESKTVQPEPYKQGNLFE